MKKRNTMKSWLFIFLNISLIGVLTSCAGREKQKDERFVFASNASFMVEEVRKPLNLDPIILNTKGGLPNSFIVNLKTCIKDALREDVSIQSARFVIEYETNFPDSKKRFQREEVVSDSNGCIQWQEEYKYKFVKNPQWIGLERTIRTKNSPYPGQVIIPMAVNPWLTESDKHRPAILDIRDQNSKVHKILKEKKYHKNGLVFLSQQSAEDFPQLWAPDIEIQIETNPQKAKDQISKKQKPESGSEKDSILSLLSPYRTECKNKKDRSCYRRYLKLDTLIPLKLRGYDTKGDIADSKINGGTYDIHIQLIAIPDENKKTYRIHEKICEHPAVALNKSESQQTKYLSLKCDMRIPQFTKNAIYKLLIEIKPSSNSQLPFKLFQGSYTIQLDFSASKRTYAIDNNTNEKYKKILGTGREINIFKSLEIKDIYDFLSKSSDISSPSDPNNIKAEFNRFSFHKPQLDGKADFKFSNVKNTEDCKKNANVVKRTVVFVGEVCLVDTLSNKKYTQTPFRVFVEKTIANGEGTSIEEVFKGSKEIYKTDQYGCISLPISLEHKIFNRQQYFHVDIHFLSESLNLYARVRPALNPWQRAFQAYQDATKLHEKDIRFTTTGVKEPELIINQFKSVNLFPSYGLDKFLNIHLFHRVYVLFQPFIKRHDNVSLGLNHQARELARDGYYMVRMLLLRNPQETGQVDRVLHQDHLDQQRHQKLNSNSNFDIENVEYMTHTDKIIKAEANFVNLYLPLHLRTEQFYYVASRNLISIEIVPVDPSGLEFHKVEKGGSCELDLEKTKWEPFFNHELINHPYVGAFNIQDWTNWNILKSSKQLDTDAIIEKSKIGRKYKRFNIKKDSSSVINNISEACVSGDSAARDLYNKPNKEENEAQTSYCYAQQKKLPLDPSHVEQIQKEKIEPLAQQDILKKFAEQNALKIVNFSKQEEEDRFIEDIGKALGKLRLKQYHLKSAEILPLIPSDDKRLLEETIDAECSDWLLGLGLDIGIWEDSSCRHKIIKAYIDDIQSKYKASQEFSVKIRLASILEKIKNTKSYYNFTINNKLPIDRNAVEDIINERVNRQNTNSPKVLQFTRSLCYFWFDSYLKDYLEKEQMISAYTNYIRKFDYYQVLEKDGLSGQQKLSVFEDFVHLVGIADDQTASEKNLANCHKKYTECIASDHCQLNFLNKTKNDYCKSISKEEESCKKVLSEECGKNPSFPLCQKKNTNCNISLNSFCRLNGDHPVCYKLSNRCLLNYHSCIKSEDTKGIFDPESVINFPFMKACIKDGESIQGPIGSYNNHQCSDTLFTDNPLNTCLNNPYQFFKFENKMLIHELSQKNPTYKSGYLNSLSAAGSFSSGSYMNWTSQKSDSFSTIVKPPDLLTFLSGGISVNGSVSIGSNESNSGRRAIDVRASQQALLSVGRAQIEIDVTKFQKCLVIKPRPNAFFSHMKSHIGLFENFESVWTDEALNKDFKKVFVSRPGLILCNPLEKREMADAEKIVEDYYYISQTMNSNNSQFLNLYDLANRPFINILRGRREFVKFYSMLRNVVEGDNGNIDENTHLNKSPENMFINYPHPIEEAVGLSLSIREFNETGFYPGVYNYSEDSDEELDIIFKKEGSGPSQFVFESIRNNIKLMSVPRSTRHPIAVQE